MRRSTCPDASPVAGLEADARAFFRRAVLSVAADLAAVAVFLGLVIGQGLGGAAGIVGLALCLVLAVLGAWVLPRPQPAAAEVLRRLDDPVAVGRLFGLFERLTHENRDALVEALVRLLPRVTPSHAAGFAEADWAHLFRLMLVCDVDRDTDLLLSVLQMLERSGDRRALPHAGRLAAGPVGSEAEARVRQMARQCVEALTRRVESDAQVGALLRPAERPAPADSLLRPAEGVGATPAESLLRALDDELPGDE